MKLFGTAPQSLLAPMNGLYEKTTVIHITIYRLISGGLFMAVSTKKIP